MTDYSDEEWEEIGRKWRRAASGDDAVRLDAPKFVRWLKHAGYIKDYVCLPDHELQAAEGKHDPDQRLVFYRQSIWNDAERGDPHATWTLIHESSHVLRNHKETRYRSDAWSRNRFSRRADHDEFEANRLTACILAPFHKADFRLGLTVDELRSRFGLSRQAATKRLEEFERMFRRQNSLRRELPAGVSDFLAAQKRKGYQVTSLQNIVALSPRDIPTFEGDPCPCCGEFMLVRNGLCRNCQNCGARMGND